MLQGVWPALATALTAGEEIDRAGLARVTDYCLAGGVYGVVVLGSTGEFPAMTEPMRAEAIETVVQTVAGRVPVVAGCGESGTKRTLMQVTALKDTGVQAALVALPYYYPLDQAAVRRYYEAIADASPLPVVLYNFPQMTKISIAPETLAALAQHHNVIGVKDSAGDFTGIQRYLAVTDGEEFRVMCGNPALGLAAYVHGAAGGIFAGCSLAPALCVSIYQAFVAGRLEEAVALQKKATTIVRMGQFGSNSAVIKLGLEKLGVCSSYTTSPLGLAQDADVRERIYDWMEGLGLEPRRTPGGEAEAYR
jgi:dihydrodipicolinate synthase/N-acetylneuraminate lyase